MRNPRQAKSVDELVGVLTGRPVSNAGTNRLVERLLRPPTGRPLREVEHDPAADLDDDEMAPVADDPAAELPPDDGTDEWKQHLADAISKIVVGDMEAARKKQLVTKLMALMDSTEVATEARRPFVR